MQPANNQRHYVEIYCTEFDPNLSRNVEITDTNSFTPTTKVQRDSKRWTQFRTSIFPELYTVCERST